MDNFNIKDLQKNNTKGGYILSSDENKLRKSELSSHEFLIKYSKKEGSYTTMRTFNNFSIICFDLHIKRLVRSYNSIVGNTVLEITQLEKRILKLLQNFIPIFKAQKKSKIIILIISNTNILIYVSKLIENKKENIEVDILEGSRTHLNLNKDIKWIKEREILEKKKQKKCEEVLLLEPDFSLREGLSSNFFIVKYNQKDNPIVITSNEKILMGSMRNIVIKAIEKNNLTIQYNTPNFKNKDDWDEAFITSTSRILLPIKFMYNNKKDICKEFKRFDTSIFLRKKVEDIVYKTSKVLI